MQDAYKLQEVLSCSDRAAWWKQIIRGTCSVYGHYTDFPDHWAATDGSCTNSCLGLDSATYSKLVIAFFRSLEDSLPLIVVALSKSFLGDPFLLTSIRSLKRVHFQILSMPKLLSHDLRPSQRNELTSL